MPSQTKYNKTNTEMQKKRFLFISPKSRQQKILNFHLKIFWAFSENGQKHDFQPLFVGERKGLGGSEAHRSIDLVEIYESMSFTPP